MKNSDAEAPGRVPSKAEGWLTSAEAAELLGLTPCTLRAYRAPSKRRSPPFHRLENGRVYYRRTDVEAHLVRHIATLDALAGVRRHD